MRYLILPVFLIFLFPLKGRSQVKSEKDYHQKLFIAVDGRIHKSAWLFSSPLNIKNSAGISSGTGINFGYNFSEKIILTAGIGFSKYVSVLSLEDYKNMSLMLDSENDEFEMHVEGKEISEKQRLSTVDFPVSISAKFPFARKTGIQLNAGIRVSLPVYSGFDGSGTFTYTGFYPKYNVTLFDIPEYGFQSNKYIKVSDGLSINPFILNLMIGPGIYYKFSDKFEILLSSFYERSLTSIMKYKAENYCLSEETGDYNTLISSSSETNLKVIGVGISLKYRFRPHLKGVN
jgi:hypothetical protein